MCKTHYYKERRGESLDIPLRKNQVADHDPVVDVHGYVLLWAPDHPNARKNKRVLEHVLVMEKFLNRYLVEQENVHHKNGNKSDNRLENLELWSTKQPYGQRVQDKIAYAKEILQLYGKDFVQP